MPSSELKLIQRCDEFCEQAELRNIPHNTRGIYVLLKRRIQRGKERFDVVYLGMARGGKSGIRSRLRAHRKKMGNEWTHFSVFEVWPNITEEEVAELEGLFRHVYRKDTKANRLNVQRGFQKLRKIKRPLPWGQQDII
ncbi:MAG TPA: hypothetical protein VFQ00_10565 [Terriglobales bacterium]|nr:hypothetical protein [Terriglobales bacterium]